MKAVPLTKIPLAPETPNKLSLGMGTLFVRSADALRSHPKIVLFVLLLCALNVLVYYAPINYAFFGQYTYPGVTLLTFLATAAIGLPIPYLPVIMQLAQSEILPLLIFCAAFGSLLGESVTYVIGRRARSAGEKVRGYARIKHAMRSPKRAWIVLFCLAAPPNPAFDVAGLAAGALEMDYPLFASAVFLARLVRFIPVAMIGSGLG